MSPAKYAHKSFIATLQEEMRAKKMPPVFVFTAGAGGRGGYVNELIIHNFTKLNEQDTELVVLLTRLLVVRASMGLMHRWRDITASCFLPVATSPDNNVLGAQLFFSPLEDATYRVYTTKRAAKSINVTTKLTMNTMEGASPLLRGIVDRINPFTAITYTDDGLKAMLSEVDLPGGGKFMTTGDVHDDIIAVATSVQHTKLEVTP